GGLDLARGELFPWIASGEGNEALRREVRRLEGRISLSVARLSGPVARPGMWDYEASGSLRDLDLDAAFLPAPLAVKSGEFRIDPETIRATGLAATTMDADLAVSGSFGGFRGGAWRLDATANGEMGPEAVRWTWERASLPADFRPAAPLALKGVRVGLARTGALSLAGGFAIREGPAVMLDLVADADGTDVRRLAIVDGPSDATISLGLRKREFAAGFSGRLSAETLEALLARKRQRHGRLEGDFRSAVPRDHPGGATAEGWLKVSDLAVPTPAGEVRVEGLDLRASGGRLSAASSSLVLDGQRLSVTGSAGFRDDGLVLDLDAVTDALSWERIEEVLDRVQKREKKTSAGGARESGKGAETAETAEAAQPAAGIPGVLGEVRFALGSFSFGKLEWKPVLGSVRLEKETTTVAVRQADLCGISTTGEVRLLRAGDASLEACVSAAGEDINVPLTCLGFSQARLTGRYEASLEAEATGEASSLPDLLRGPLSLKASNGRIAKANVLTRILDVLNVTNLFSGMARSTLGEALTYRDLSIGGWLDGSVVRLDDVTLKTPSFTLATTGEVDARERTVNLTVLARPFSTVDRVIGWIPVLRYVLGGNFASVGARVTGSLDDPKVDLSPAKDVTQGLVDILGRAVKWPVHAVDPKGP
ncbi:MAG TPA: AsmA-like C-terminal domain-containing protein, partial [Thermoanaerobaculia bacterium]|nr:AsmA-like C-terminal domain-containing protein [Thermoanaerobaculia bacterium]